MLHRGGNGLQPGPHWYGLPPLLLCQMVRPGAMSKVKPKRHRISILYLQKQLANLDSHKSHFGTFDDDAVEGVHRMMLDYFEDLGPLFADLLSRTASLRLSPAISTRFGLLNEASLRLPPPQARIGVVEPPTELEIKILEELGDAAKDGKGLTAESLTKRLGRSRFHRSVDGVRLALTHLRELGQVKNKMGLGYYRTDSPPKPIV